MNLRIAGLLLLLLGGCAPQNVVQVEPRQYQFRGPDDAEYELILRPGMVREARVGDWMCRVLVESKAETVSMNCTSLFSGTQKEYAGKISGQGVAVIIAWHTQGKA